MKTLIVCMAAILLLGIASPLAAQQKADSTLLSGPQIIARVDGLACPFCAYGLEKKLKKLDGIQKVEIRVDKGEALLTLKKGAALRKSEIKRAIQNAGFTPRAVFVLKATGIQLKVKGVTCEGCIDRVKAAIKDTPCAEITSVNFKTKEASLICNGDPSQHRMVMDRIKALGFEVDEIQKRNKP